MSVKLHQHFLSVPVLILQLLTVVAMGMMSTCRISLLLSRSFLSFRDSKLISGPLDFDDIDLLCAYNVVRDSKNARVERSSMQASPLGAHIHWKPHRTTCTPFKCFRLETRRKHISKLAFAYQQTESEKVLLCCGTCRSLNIAPLLIPNDADHYSHDESK